MSALSPAVSHQGNSELILGSSSEVRQEILSRTQQSFRVLSPDIDERLCPEKIARVRVQVLAKAKARKVKGQLEQNNELGCILSFDQVVLVYGELREKPVDEDQAALFLRSSHSVPVDIINGIYALNMSLHPITGAVMIREEGTTNYVKVRFKPLSAEEIQAAVQLPAVRNSAGALAAYTLACNDFPSRIEYLGGEQEVDSLLGFPLQTTAHLLKKVRFFDELPPW